MISRPLTFFLALAALTAAAPAQAQLRDALLIEREGGPHLWLAFAAQPASTFIEGGVLYVIGVESEAARTIIPAGPAPFSALRVEPEGDGVRITLSGAAMETAEVRAGGVWLMLDAQGWAAPPVARVAAASPDPDAAPVRPFAPAPGNMAASAASPAAPDAEPASPSPSHGAAPAAPDAEAEPAQTSPPSPATPAQRAAAVNPACADVAQSLEDAPWDLDLIAAKGSCLVQAGAPAEARTQFERVLAFEPDHVPAALGLARLKEAAGELSAAAALYDIAARGARTDGEALEAMAAARRLREASGG
jgi:tetratricopeptide (TPR) repeat protein